MEIKKLISKLEYANTKIKLMNSEARKKIIIITGIFSIQGFV
jgi:hypothetical protein